MTVFSADSQVVRPSSPAATNPAQDVDQLIAEGRSRQQAGHWEEAAEHYRMASLLAPERAVLPHLLGIVALQQKQISHAIELFRKACSIEPEVAGYHRNLGEALQAGGDFAAALLSLEQSVRLEPTHPGGWVAMSECLMQIGQLTPAIDCLQQALQLDAHSIPARFLLGNLQKQLGDLAAAAANYRFVLERNPRQVAAAVNLASILRSQGQVEEALNLLQNAVQAEAPSPFVLYNLANLLVDLGDFATAKVHYAAALPDHPRPAKVLYNLSTVWKFTEADRDQLREWTALARRRQNSREDAIHLQFALGKAHDDLGEYVAAFQHYQSGNEFVPVEFSPAAHHAEIQSVIERWSAEFVRSRTIWGDETTAPIFIVGMPRSGTTLLEQVLAAHSHVLPLGERLVMGELVGELAASLGCGDDLDRAAALFTEADSYELAQGYLKEVSLEGDQTRFTDKMPTNFLLLGWIAAVFPNATILHMQRDPRDVCLSCYFQNFTARLPFAFDLQNLIAYYRDYERLMQHWHAVLPGRILDVAYPELVTETEATVRKILTHCGLAWEEACAHPETGSRPVRTASNWQVRQKISVSSLDRWKNYRAQIPELLQAFGE